MSDHRCRRPGAGADGVIAIDVIVLGGGVAIIVVLVVVVVVMVVSSTLVITACRCRAGSGGATVVFIRVPGWSHPRKVG